MLAAINRLLDWLKSLFWKEEMELTLVGLQNSGKTTFVNVIAVSEGKLRGQFHHVPFFFLMPSSLVSFART